MQGAEGPRWRDNFEGGAGILGQARYGTGLVLVFGWVRKGDWGLGIGDGRARPGVQSTRRMDSGQRHQACRTGDGGPWTWGAMAHWAPGIQWGGRVRSLQCDVRSTNQEMRQSRKQAPGNPTLFRQTVRNHNHDRNTPSPFHVLFSCWRVGDGITALQPLEEEGGSLSPPAPPPRGPPPLLLFLLLHRDRTHPPPSPFSTTPMLASATSERGDCHLGVVDKESPGTEVTGDGRTTLKKDPLTHRVTTNLTDMTFLPPGKPPRADNESRMRIAAKARADGCAKNDGHYFGPGTEHTLLLFLVKLGFSGAPLNKWSGLFSPLFLHMFIQPGNNSTWGLRWLAGLAPSSRHHRPAT